MKKQRDFCNAQNSPLRNRETSKKGVTGMAKGYYGNDCYFGFDPESEKYMRFETESAYYSYLLDMQEGGVSDGV